MSSWGYNPISFYIKIGPISIRGVLSQFGTILYNAKQFGFSYYCSMREMPMTTMASIEIPKEILRATRMTPTELKVELAITLFRENKLSFGKAREMVDMDAWTFQQLLGSRGISPHYDVSDYEEDLATLSEIE